LIAGVRRLMGVTPHRNLGISPQLDQTKHANLVREIFCNPFRPLSFNPTWQTSTVQQLADAIYQEQAFDRLLILADALLDAGCDSTELLNHLRQHAEHVRGCWALDLVLGKE